MDDEALRLAVVAHTSQPWRIHELTRDFRVEDVWALPARGRQDEFPLLVEAIMSRDIAVQAAEMLAAAGAKDISVFQEISPPGLAIHEMGTARMGRDPKTSVLNAHNQAHEVKNLFMTDGACMASNSCVNPSLTYMALTARACDFAVGAMKRNEI